LQRRLLMRCHRTTLIDFPVCASALLLGACAHRVTERETIREQPVVVNQAPAPEQRILVTPAPREEIVASPAPSGSTWVPGRYVRRADRWEWVPGRWVAASDSQSGIGPKGSGSTGVAPIGAPAAEY
jgi:hypothetical protein